MVEFPMTITVRCMGEFHGYSYVGGKTIVMTIFSHNVFNLRYGINHELPAEWMSSDYEMCYLSHSWETGTNKHVLESDDDLWQLCGSQTDPVVYVDHGRWLESANEGTSASGSGSQMYVPQYEYPQSSGYNSQYPELDQGLDSIKRLASFDWFAEYDRAVEDYVPNIPQPPAFVPDVEAQLWGKWDEPEATSFGQDWNNYGQHTYEQEEHTTEPEIVHNEADAEGNSSDDAEDPNYEEHTDDDASEDLSEDERITFSLCDFAAWVNREGGIGNLLSAINSTEPEDDTSELLADQPELSNWLVPIIPLDSAAAFVDVDYDPSRATELRKKAEFETKEEFIIAVGLWNLKHGGEARTRDSDRTRVVFICKHSPKSCPFTARASTSEKLIWTCYKFKGEHTCTREVGMVIRIKASAAVVAKHVADKIYDNSDLIRPKTIQLDLQREFGVKISYGVALRARNLAIEMIYGGHEKSYQMLPSYLHMLKRSNRGSIVDWEMGPDGNFKHCFVALGATRTPFMFTMRPVIVIDGTHLKGKGKGVLFIAATKDGNEQLYPLAYGVGPKENDESWIWFLERLKTAYGRAHPLLVVSDAHVSIANAVRAVMPHATHGLCYYHLQKKMRVISDEVWKAFRRAAYSYEKSDCDDWMRKIKSVNPTAYEKLKNIGEDKWSRSHCKVKRYSFMTSNAAESFNSRLMWARRLPICSLLEAIRIVIEEWFSERRAAANSSSELLTSAAHDRLAAETVRSRRYTVTKVRSNVYRVKANHRRILVDLNRNECECGVFQNDELPCSHAIVAIGYDRILLII